MSYYTATSDGMAQSALQCAAGGAGFAINGLSTMGQMQAVAAYLAGRLTALTRNGDASSALQSRARANGWTLNGYLSDIAQVQTVAANLAGFSVTPTSDGMANAAMMSAGAARGISFAGLGREGATALMLANLTASVVSYSPGGTNYPAINETRATTAWYLDSAQNWRSAASGVLRDSAYAYNNNTSAFERVTLLELSAKNLLVQSDALATTWTAVGTITPSNAAATKANRSFSSLTATFGSNYVKQAVTFTGNAVKSVELNIAQNGTDAGTFAFQLYDATSSASLLTCTVTIAAGGTCTAACTTGTLESITALANGAYFVKCLSASATAAHTNEIRLGTAGTAASVLLSGVFAGDVLFPTSLVPTTTAAVTRNADVAYLDLAGTALAVPRESTWYFKFIELGTAQIANGYLFAMGDAATAGTNTLLVLAPSGKYLFEFASGGTGATAAAAAAPTLNDLVELLCYVDASGTPHLTQAINGVAAATVDGGSSQSFQPAYKDTHLNLNNNRAGSFNGTTGIQSIRACPGKQSLATMRNLP